LQPERDPDVPWVQELSGHPRGECEAAIAEAQGERRLFQYISREHASEGRDSYVEIDAPLELHALTRLLRPLHVVEVGVSSGVSSAYILNALEKNGRGTLHSIDLPAQSRPPRNPGKPPRMSWSLPPGRSSGWAVPFLLKKRWDLRLGDKAAVLPLLAKELPRVDFFVYDVPHRDPVTRVELRDFDPLFPPGAVVLVDHGPGGEMCSALRGWGRTVGARPVGRSNLGLYGVRRPVGSVGAPLRSRANVEKTSGVD